MHARMHACVRAGTHTHTPSRPPCTHSFSPTSAPRPAPGSQLRSSCWSGSGTGSRSADSRSWTPGRRHGGSSCVGRGPRVGRRWRVGGPPAGPAHPPSSPVGGTEERTRRPAVRPRGSAGARTARRDTYSRLRPYGVMPRESTPRLQQHEGVKKKHTTQRTRGVKRWGKTLETLTKRAGRAAH